jgi:hypothetical protein
MNTDGLKKEEIYELLKRIGENLGYSAQREVNTGVSKVDLVWFDRKIAVDLYRKPESKELAIEGTMLIPIVGFEVEEKTAVRKILRGDIDSLNSLYPSLGVLVLSSIMKQAHFKRQLKVTNSKEKATKRSEKWFDTDIRFARKVASMNPFRRIIVLTDLDVVRLDERISAMKKREHKLRQSTA